MLVRDELYSAGNFISGKQIDSSNSVYFGFITGGSSSLSTLCEYWSIPPIIYKKASPWGMKQVSRPANWKAENKE